MYTKVLNLPPASQVLPGLSANNSSCRVWCSQVSVKIVELSVTASQKEHPEC